MLMGSEKINLTQRKNKINFLSPLTDFLLFLYLKKYKLYISIFYIFLF